MWADARENSRCKGTGVDQGSLTTCSPVMGHSHSISMSQNRVDNGSDL